MHIAEIEHGRDDALATALDAEFDGLLDRVDGVAARVDQSDDLRLGGLRLKQERGEILAVDRRANTADDGAAQLLHDGLDLLFHRVPERVVGGQREPALAAFRDYRARGPR